MAMTPDFWRGRRVLVTGHTGFKGSWLCLWLERLGAAVLGYALEPPTDPSLFDAADVARGITSRHGDVRNVDELAAAMAEHRAQVVFHLAAQPIVRYSFDNPLETFSTNVMGTVHVLEAARRTPTTECLVNVTSDKCYENREWWWGYREVDRLGGHDPYSCSKGCAELVTSAYRRSYFETDGPAVASARAGNVIGGGDWAADRLVPDLVRAFSTGRPAVVRNPCSIRPWQHVLESLHGYLRLAEALTREGRSFAEPWNFAPDDEGAVTTGDLATRLASCWGEGASWNTEHAGDAPHEARFLKLDASKAKARLGWRPLLTFDETLSWTAEVYKCFAANGDPRAGALEQVERFQARLVQQP